MADIGWRRRRGSSPAARTGARQRAGLTPPPPPTHFHASERRFTHNSSGQSKKSIDSDHGIYRVRRVLLRLLTAASGTERRSPGLNFMPGIGGAVSWSNESKSTRMTLKRHARLAAQNEC